MDKMCCKHCKLVLEDDVSYLCQGSLGALQTQIWNHPKVLKLKSRAEFVLTLFQATYPGWGRPHSEKCMHQMLMPHWTTLSHYHLYSFLTQGPLKNWCQQLDGCTSIKELKAAKITLCELCYMDYGYPSIW